MKFIDELSHLYASILNEDYQSSVAQSLNILKNNQVQNPETVNSELEKIFNNVRIEEEENRAGKKDTDIPMLAFMYLANVQFDEISNLYRQYVNSKASYQSGILNETLQDLRTSIQARDLLKPSQEKTELIISKVNQLTALIHRNYKSKDEQEDVDINNADQDDKVYEDDKIAVFIADSKKKCILYGDQNLCISVRPGAGLNYYWRYRMGRMRDDKQGMTTYFVFWKDKSNKILVDALGNEDGTSGEYSWNPISTNTDSDIAQDALIRKFPELKPAFDSQVFKFIPYGQNEARFADIDENIKSILDNRLKSLEDYDMFIESGKDVTESEWESLNPRLASILFKKYVGMYPSNIPMKIFDKFITKGTDIKWFEEKIAPRNTSLALQYYLHRNGSLKINENFKKEILDVLKSEIEKAEKFKNLFIITDNKYDYGDVNVPEELHVLPDFSNITITGNFNCGDSKITSLEGAPKEVGGNFNCYDTNITSLEGAPKVVGGNFYCSSTNITSLEGAPKVVGGNFYCSGTKITSLECAPEKVGGHFYCNKTKITSLEGAPKEIGGNFSCSDTGITSLEGAPKEVGGNFYCYNTKITSLEGAAKVVGGDFDCSGTKITSLEGSPKVVGGDFSCSDTGITSLEGAPKVVGGDFSCSGTKITSLEGAPKVVGGNFNCYNIKITSLEGSPKVVGGYFDCSGTKITSLEGSPKVVSGNFYCSNTKITSLEGSPKVVGGHFDCNGTNITSLEGAPKEIGGEFYSYIGRKGIIGNSKKVRDKAQHIAQQYLNKIRNAVSSKEQNTSISENYKSSEYSTFNSLLESFQLLNDAVDVSKLEQVTISKISRDMANLERRYFPSHLSQDFDDIESDAASAGFTGYGIFDDDKVKGYIYGYSISEDEYEDLEYIDFSKVDFYNDALKAKLLTNDDYSETFKRIFTPRNTLYVSNLVVDSTHRRHTYKLINEMLNELRQNGYKYIAFDALSDTVNLFMDKSGNIKADRLKKSGLTPLLSFTTSYSRMSLFSI
jgi:hypothetical protein